MTTDYSMLSNEEIQMSALNMTSVDLGREINKMTNEQITLVISAIQPERERDWEGKLQSLYKNIQKTEQFEAFGKGLSLSQCLFLLETLKNEPDHHKHLSSILVGLPQPVFLSILRSASAPQMATLQNEGLSEAIQHHLTIYHHEMTKKVEQELLILEALPIEIQTLDTRYLNRQDVEKVEEKINRSQLSFSEITENINRALLLAWNTNRIDLIERLSYLKEQCLRVQTLEIGSARNKRTPPSGLFLILENHLSTVFDNSENRNEMQPLEDDDPAIEALARFSLWYLEDYWKIGLLPNITDEKALSLDSKSYSEKQCLEHREELVRQIYENLQNLCLVTVQDLKAAGIYSKNMLKTYIADNKDLLT